MSVKNFRKARRLSNIYRCANTDNLASRIGAEPLPEAERILFYQVGLIIDLRSDSERDEEKAQKWMSQAPGGPFLVIYKKFNLSKEATYQRKRTVLRLDPLKPSQLMNYLDKHWMSTEEKAKATFYNFFDGGRLHNLRIDVLNRKGLSGLNEAILETGKQEMLSALEAMTVHLETSPRDSIVVHCVQGKDRTGVLIMLCQSIVGVPDHEIIQCYHESEAIITGAAAANIIHQYASRKGKLDRNLFSAAPKEVMDDTLARLRSNYGSVSPGYLDAIGFHEDWRRRFAKVLASNASSKL
jgi:protein tyrosine/serine phosphatase